MKYNKLKLILLIMLHKYRSFLKCISIVNNIKIRQKKKVMALRFSADQRKLTNYKIFKSS